MTTRERKALAELATMGLPRPHLMEPIHVAGRRLQKAVEEARIELERFLHQFADSAIGQELAQLTDPLEDAAAELNSKVQISPADLLAHLQRRMTA